MDDLSELLIDARTEEKFVRLFKNTLKKNKFTAERRGTGDYYFVSDGNESLGFDISADKIEYAKTRSPEIAERILERIRYDFYVLERLVSFTNGQEFLRYTVKRSEEIGKGMIWEDFYGNLKKVICYTSDNVHARILSDSCMKRWDVPKEVLFSVADRNMCRMLKKADFCENTVNVGSGIKCLEFKGEGNDFTVSYIMCADFYGFASEKLGHRFLVAAPSKDTAIVLTEVTNNVLERLGSAFVSEYRWASSPLTTDIFLYTSSGIEIAGHFSEI